MHARPRRRDKAGKFREASDPCSTYPSIFSLHFRARAVLHSAATPYVARDKIAAAIIGGQFGPHHSSPSPSLVLSFFLSLNVPPRHSAALSEAVKQLQRSLKPSICMAATSRFSRRLRRFSGPDLKVRCKVRQLEITSDKRTFCARQLPRSLPSPSSHLAQPLGGHSPPPFKCRRTGSSVYIIKGPLTSGRGRKENLPIVAKRIISCGSSRRIHRKSVLASLPPKSARPSDSPRLVGRPPRSPSLSCSET